jgi:Xaa-Pro aminopeptidase
MNRFSKETEYGHRIQRFQNHLVRFGMDGALLVEKVDVYYLSGTDQDAHLWVPASGEPLLLVRKSFVRAREDAALSHMVPLRTLSALPERIRDHQGRLPSHMGLEMDVLPARLYLTYRKLFPQTEMGDISPLIRAVRMVKSDYERSCISRAAETADRLFEQVPGFLAESETMNDLAARADTFHRSQGHPGLVRSRAMAHLHGEIMSGKADLLSGAPSGLRDGIGPGLFHRQGGGNGRIRRNAPIIVDRASNVEGYIADQARVYCLGTLPDRLLRAHDLMLDIQNRLAERGMPGVRAGDLYERALDMAERAGLSEGFMGYPEPAPYVGHGIGLEIDEWPLIGRNSSILLEENMVTTLEPRMVFPDLGMVGIKNAFVVTGRGLRRLSRFPDPVFTC